MTRTSYTIFILIDNDTNRSIQPWLQRDDEKSMKHGDQQILQSVGDRSVNQSDDKLYL